MSRNHNVEPTLQQLKTENPVFAAWLEDFKLSTAKHHEEARRRSVVCRHENLFMALGYSMMIGGAFGTLFTAMGSTSPSGTSLTRALMIVSACGILMLLFTLSRSGNNSWIETWAKIFAVLCGVVVVIVPACALLIHLLVG